MGRSGPRLLNGYEGPVSASTVGRQILLSCRELNYLHILPGFVSFLTKPASQFTFESCQNHRVYQHILK